MLESYNKSPRIMKRAIIIAAIALLVVVTIVLWLVNSGESQKGSLSLMLGIQLIVLVFAVLVVVKRWTAAKNKLPAEDEMSKGILRRGAGRGPPR
jgi:hypothetical protein